MEYLVEKDGMSKTCTATFFNIANNVDIGGGAGNICSLKRNENSFVIKGIGGMGG
jgi:hypothetical protein